MADFTAHSILATLVSGRPLAPDEAAFFFGELLAGRLDTAHISAGLAMIQQRGVSVEELVAGARAMRAHLTPVPTDPSCGVVIDTCSTGGAPKTFNVSTIAAIVAASVPPPAGKPRVLVAKHGNKSRTGRGSTEFLEALGVNVNATPAQQSACLRDVGVCFCFAVHHHPATRTATPARQALGFPTIFNLLGPLTNPARATRQVIGVYNPTLATKVAESLARLGCERAFVLHSDDGLDELTITGDTRVWDVAGGRVTERRITLADVEAMGLQRATLPSLQAADLPHAVDIAHRVLRNENFPPRDMVLLSAGAALHVAGMFDTLAEGVKAAREGVTSHRASHTLQRLREVSHA